MMNRLRFSGIVAVALAAGCTAVPPPQPRPAPAPATPPPAPPPPEPVAADWRDLPLTPGDWSYASDGTGSHAAFGTAGGARFDVRCTLPGRGVTVAGAGAGPAMTIRTSFGVRTLATTANPAGRVSATLAAADPLLDGMAFSRGHFTVAVDGASLLVIPAWPEFARVVEDCRS